MIENNQNFLLTSRTSVEELDRFISFVKKEINNGSYNFSNDARLASNIIIDDMVNWVKGIADHLSKIDGEYISIADLSYIKVTSSRNYAKNMSDISHKVLNKDLLSLWRSTHMCGYQSILVEDLSFTRKPKKTTRSDVILSLVEHISTKVNEIKYRLYEIDYLMFDGKDPFICVTDIANSQLVMNERSTIAECAGTYNSFFNKNMEYEILNYSSSNDISDHIKAAEEHGIKISGMRRP